MQLCLCFESLFICKYEVQLDQWNLNFSTVVILHKVCHLESVVPATIPSFILWMVTKCRKLAILSDTETEIVSLRRRCNTCN
jgi:hypothetical protein